MNAGGKCGHCGALLPADLLAAICPQCELRGALNSFAEAHQNPLGADSLASGTSNPAADTGSFRQHGTDEFRERRFGDYELLAEIARGGMGVVYRARQMSLDRVVAVKMMILSGSLSGNDAIQRFRTEAAAAASLQHPNIVAVHEVGFAEGQHYFAMDLVIGPTLAQLAAQGPVPHQRSAKYLKIIAEAVHFAHERHVLHRDLKPSNVLIDSATDQPRLTDFGLAKRIGSETELTLNGQMLGSPNYMSPEQVTAKSGTVGKRSDVYSLGAIFYYLLTGRPPFQGETLTDVTHQVVHNEPLAPHLLLRRCPRDLETICLKCLEKAPASRYQTAQALAEELGRFLRGEPILARPVSPMEKASRWCQRRPAVAGLSLATVLLLLAVAIGSPLAIVRITRARERADQNLYDSDMSLAQHAWDDGDPGRTLSLLDAHQLRLDEPDRREFEWFYFWNLCRGDQRMTLRGNGHAMNCVALSPDGTFMAIGSVGDSVQIWNRATEKRVRTLPEPNVVSLAFAPDGHLLGVGGRDQVVVWDLDSGRAIFRKEDVFARFHLAFSPVENQLVIGRHGGPLELDGGSAEIWDYRTDERKQVFPESGGYEAVSAHGYRLATGNWDQSVKIWDLKTGELVNSLPVGPLAMALSPDGGTLATGGWGTPITLWKVATGREIASLTNDLRRVSSLAFSPDDKFLAAGGADQAIHLWNMKTLQPDEPLRGHGSEVMSVAFSAAGETLASGSRDNTARVWKVHPTRTAVVVSNVISRPIFSADGRYVAAGVDENRVVVWDAATLRPKSVFADAHTAVAFSTDGHELLTRATNYFLRTFNLDTGAIRGTISRSPVEEVDSYTALSPNGQILAEGHTNGTVTFSNAKTGDILATAPHAYSGAIFQMAFSRDGKLLASVGKLSDADMVVPAATVWDTATFKIVAKPAGHTGLLLTATFSPDGKTLLTSSIDDTVRFWDTSTWRESMPPLAQKDYLDALAISPNGRTLATACSDGTLKLWNLTTAREVSSFAIGGEAMQIAFSPDGQTLAIRTWTGSLRLWRAPGLENQESRTRDR